MNNEELPPLERQLTEVAILHRSELARQLRLTERTLRGWAERGVGPRYVKHEGVRGYYLVSDVQQWLAGRPAFLDSVEAGQA